MEDNVFKNPESATHQGNRFLETLINQIFEEESINLPRDSLDKKIEKLYKFNVLDSKIRNLFSDVRHQRNKGIHGDPSIESSLKFNRSLFEIAVWFYKKYSDDYNKEFKYKEPCFEKSALDDEVIEFKVNEYLNNVIKSSIEEKINFHEDNKKSEGNMSDNDDLIYPTTDVVDEKEVISAENEDTCDFIGHGYDFAKTNGSYLINELNKLNISSKESVDDSAGLDYFKEYIHIDRDIQDKLHEKLIEIENKQESHLIMLVGSVGDGKSHLLSYMNSKYSNLMRNFSVHNDATESFDPKLTAIETLLSVLKPFNDDNIDFNSEKLILAINLGILNDLLEDDDFKINFSRLRTLLKDSNIFNPDNFNEFDSSFLSIINFSDYQLYELNEDKLSSSFLEELFSKITLESLENPFYNAYNMDKNIGVSNPVIINYEMLLNKDVSDNVIQILIKYIIKNKKLISTRDILNFVYEILVPSDMVDGFNKENVTDYVEELLPSLLFNSKSRSKLLKEISDDTPINIRDCQIDDFLILVNTSSMELVVDEYFGDYAEIDFFKKFLINDFASLANSDKRLIKDNLIYFALFFGKDEIKKAFIDYNYDKFVKYLYYYNYKPKELRKFFTDIKNSIFKWKGMLKKGIILIDELNNFRIGTSFDINFKKITPIENTNKNKFKNYIQFNVLFNDEECSKDCNQYCELDNCVKLNIDYHLCETIIKINKGYQPNKNEKENLVVFNDFIETILSKVTTNRVLVENKRYGTFYEFKKSYEGYIFEEE